MCTKGENEQRQARWWSANLTAAPLRELIVHVRDIIGTRGQEGPELLIGQEGVVLRGLDSVLVLREYLLPEQFMLTNPRRDPFENIRIG